MRYSLGKKPEHWIVHFQFSRGGGAGEDHHGCVGGGQLVVDLEVLNDDVEALVG